MLNEEGVNEPRIVPSLQALRSFCSAARMLLIGVLVLAVNAFPPALAWVIAPAKPGYSANIRAVHVDDLSYVIETRTMCLDLLGVRWLKPSIIVDWKNFLCSAFKRGRRQSELLTKGKRQIDGQLTTENIQSPSHFSYFPLRFADVCGDKDDVRQFAALD